MPPEITLMAHPQRAARLMLGFVVAVAVGLSFVFRGARDFFGLADRSVMVLQASAGVVVLVAGGLLLPLAVCRGTQTWRLSGGRLSYRSPSPLLGASFEVAWDDVVRVGPSDTEGARCEMVDGSHVEFPTGSRAGQDFYFLIARMKSGAENPADRNGPD